MQRKPPPEDFTKSKNPTIEKLSQCLTHHLLSLLLHHLGQAGMSGTCWVDHWWRKQLGRGMVVLVCFERRECIFFPCCSGRLGKERYEPHSVVGPLAFLVFLLMCVRARHSYRATNRATACWAVEGYRTPNDALVC